MRIYCDKYLNNKNANNIFISLNLNIINDIIIKIIIYYVSLTENFFFERNADLIILDKLNAIIEICLRL